LTVTEAATHLSSHFGCDIPVWKVRRTVDAMDLDIQRIANYRLIPRTALDQIAETLRPFVAAHRVAEPCVAGGCEQPGRTEQGGTAQ
jgi:hypothetical protein